MKHAPVLLSALLLTACQTSIPASDGSEGPETTYISPGMAKNDIHGQETFLAIGAMEGHGGKRANGLAMIRGFHDGAAVVTVRVNIKSADAGSHYEARLESSDAADMQTLGSFTQPRGDAWHELQYEIKDLKQKNGFKIVVISVQNDSQNTPGITVAEGVLKGSAR